MSNAFLYKEGLGRRFFHYSDSWRFPKTLLEVKMNFFFHMFWQTIYSWQWPYVGAMHTKRQRKQQISLLLKCFQPRFSSWMQGNRDLGSRYSAFSCAIIRISLNVTYLSKYTWSWCEHLPHSNLQSWVLDQRWCRHQNLLQHDEEQILPSINGHPFQFLHMDLLGIPTVKKGIAAYYYVVTKRSSCSTNA